jgi:hypothetical protein
MKSIDLRTMVESHSWTWLLDLGRHLNVAIDIVDDQCIPLLPMDGSDPSDDHAELRNLLAMESSPLRSTVAIATPSTAHAVAIDHQLCICHGLSDAGTLVVARKMKAGGAEDSRLELESIGIWLAAALGSLKTSRLRAEYTFATVDKDATQGAYATDGTNHTIGRVMKRLGWWRSVSGATTCVMRCSPAAGVRWLTLERAEAVTRLLPRYVEPAGPKPLRRWLTGLF